MAKGLGAMDLKKMLQTTARTLTGKSIVGLFYGGSGSGKTAFCRDLPRPILVHLFDPDGAKPLIEMNTTDGINLWETGNLIVEDFSDEDLNDPKQYEAWRKRFDELRGTSKFFNNVGTFVLDSATTLGMAIWAQVLKLRKKNTNVMAEVDLDEFTPAKNVMMRAIRDILSLPCNVVIIAHEAVQEDKQLGTITRTPAFIGNQRITVPLLFSEVWHFVPTTTAKNGFGVRIQVLSCARVHAKTRMGGNGVFKVYEENESFLSLCKKAKREIIHKQSFIEALQKQQQEEGVEAK